MVRRVSLLAKTLHQGHQRPRPLQMVNTAQPVCGGKLSVTLRTSNPSTASSMFSCLLLFCIFPAESALSQLLKTDLCIHWTSSLCVSHHCAVFAWAAAWVACLGIAGITQCRAAHRVLRTGWRGCLGWLRLPLLVASGQTGNQFKDFLCNSD